MIQNEVLQGFISKHPKLLIPVSVSNENIVSIGFTFCNNLHNVFNRSIIGSDKPTALSRYSI